MLVIAGIVSGIVLVLALVAVFLGVRYIPNNKIGIVEKLWSPTGSLGDGQIVALNGEAGYQADILRGGIHLGFWRWQFAVHKRPLVIVKQGKIGYVFARGGKPLSPSQTLGQVIDSNYFQDARAFLRDGGQRGRQRAILREGVYAVNLALFNVITEDGVYALEWTKDLGEWQESLRRMNGFEPVVVGATKQGEHDEIGIVTVHEGPALPQGEIIAPAVGMDPLEKHCHNNYQDVEAFLAAGGRRGLQYAPLIDGTYFINRWFATIEFIPKEIVPIGSVGVVVSYCGRQGTDTSGVTFRHGERVHEGERGVWENTLGPGKYPFNRYAGQIVHVPTTNFVLHWITGRTEDHRYDDSLKSIELITRDAYEPTLPLSVVVHIDYQKAPNVIQRFGDVKQLITQTLDPLLSAYFRDIAHRKSMLELIHDRDLIQSQAREELRAKFSAFDIECVDVLIGKPEAAKGDNSIENLLEQLRQRQYAVEQMETFAKQEAAAAHEKTLNEAKAKAALQPKLTQSKIQIEMASNEADAELARARKKAEQTIVLAEANARQAELEGKGQAEMISQVGTAEADVLKQKVASFGDPRYYALSVIADQLANSKQPLVPSQLFVTGGTGHDAGGGNMLSALVGLMTADRLGFDAKPIIARATEIAPSTNGA